MRLMYRKTALSAFGEKKRTAYAPNKTHRKIFMMILREETIV